MKKAFITACLDEYKNYKSISKFVFGPTALIKDLNNFNDIVLNSKEENHTLSKAEEVILYNLLKRHKSAMEEAKINLPQKKTIENHIHLKLCFKLAKDSYDKLRKPKIQPIVEIKAPENRCTKITKYLANSIYSLWQNSSMPKVSTAESKENNEKTENLFKFSEVIPGLNNSHRLYMDEIDTLDPKKLFLTDTNYLIYEEDILREFKSRLQLINSEIPKDDKGYNLSQLSVNRLLHTKPETAKELCKIMSEQRNMSREISETSIKKILKTGQKMRGDYSRTGEPGGYPKSYKALKELNIYLSTKCGLTERNIILNFTVENYGSFGKNLNQADICRHSLGTRLIHFAHQMKLHCNTSNNKIKDPTLKLIATLNPEDISNSTLNNGLRLQ